MAKPNVISREDLIEAAKQCITEKGADKTTLNAVAHKAGVTQGTVFYHFRTKERLLLEVVEDMCEKSWQSLEAYMGNGQTSVREALAGSKSRCTFDSPYHKLFYSLLAAGFHQTNIREQLGKLLQRENESLGSILSLTSLAGSVEGVSPAAWGILLNAVIDGLAIQALLDEHFPRDEAYDGLEKIIIHLMKG